MESDDQPSDPRYYLMRQPWWFRWQWRFREWRRQRILKRMYRDPKYAKKFLTRNWHNE